jgi:hypothetical protein
LGAKAMFDSAFKEELPLRVSALTPSVHENLAVGKQKKINGKRVCVMDGKTTGWLVPDGQMGLRRNL